MKILVADDNPLRVDYYRVLVHLDWALLWATTAEAGAESITRGSPYDILALDHDFRPADCFADPAETTGRGLATAVASLPVEKRPRLVIIHSANVLGRQAMEATLRGVGIEPVVSPLPNIFV